MTKLQWFDVPELDKEMAFLPRKKGTLVLHYEVVWMNTRVAEFNGYVLGFAATQEEAEELLFHWANGIAELVRGQE